MSARNNQGPSAYEAELLRNTKNFSKLTNENQKTLLKYITHQYKIQPTNSLYNRLFELVRQVNKPTAAKILQNIGWSRVNVKIYSNEAWAKNIHQVFLVSPYTISTSQLKELTKINVPKRDLVLTGPTPSNLLKRGALILVNANSGLAKVNGSTPSQYFGNYFLKRYKPGMNKLINNYFKTHSRQSMIVLMKEAENEIKREKELRKGRETGFIPQRRI